MTKIVQVELHERSYPIWIGTEAWDQNLQQAVERLPSLRHAFIVWDEHLKDLSNQLASQLESLGVRVSPFQVASGEGSKCVEGVAEIWNAMLREKSDRKTALFAVGGGVVGDLAGFAASTFMRGVRFVQIPTTLLAMVDSSVGGKTGINLPSSKNIVGAFWQPHGVLIDTSILRTLPDREYLSGMAEIVKYGVILDAEFFATIEENVPKILDRDPATLEHLIERSCELKAYVVANDERETTGLRAILNYGHTFGHAIEAVTSYGTYLHGEAISIGMTMAGGLAVSRGLWSEEEFQRQTKLFKVLHLPTFCESAISLEGMLGAMQSDKKNEHGVLTLILPTKLGHVQSVRDIPSTAVTEIVQRYTPHILS